MRCALYSRIAQSIQPQVIIQQQDIHLIRLLCAFVRFPLNHVTNFVIVQPFCVALMAHVILNYIFLFRFSKPNYVLSCLMFLHDLLCFLLQLWIDVGSGEPCFQFLRLSLFMLELEPKGFIVIQGYTSTTSHAPCFLALSIQSAYQGNRTAKLNFIVPDDPFDYPK